MPVSRRAFPVIIADALRAYSEDFRLSSPHSPVQFSLNGQLYSAHVSLIHDSGEGREDDDEQRIQVTRARIDAQAAALDAGKTAVFLGIFPDGRVFSAWEPEHVFAQRAAATGTIYARRSHYEIASRYGAALRVSRSRNLERDVATVSFPIEILGVYLENWRAIHSVRSENELRNLYAAVADQIERPIGTQTEADIDIQGERRRITVQRTAFPRDPAFARQVLAAYGAACCICGRQMGLVEAAHIIPHSDPDCPNHVTNGVALCIEHHRLYDDGLILLRPHGRVELNERRVEHLVNIGQDAGLDELRELVAQGYRILGDANVRPSHEYLDRGRAIRLGLAAPGGG